jgi:hypothetical protein
MSIFFSRKTVGMCLCVLMHVVVTAAADVADFAAALEKLTVSFQSFQKALAPDQGDDNEEPIEPVEPVEPIEPPEEPTEPVEPIEDHAFDDLYAVIASAQSAYEHDSEQIIQTLQGDTMSGAEYLAIVQQYDDKAPQFQATLELVLQNAQAAQALPLSEARKGALKSILELYNAITQNNSNTLNTAKMKLDELKKDTKSTLDSVGKAYKYSGNPWSSLGIASRGATPESIYQAWQAKDDLLLSGDINKKRELEGIRDYLINELLPATQNKEAAEKASKDAQALPIYNSPMFEDSVTALQAIIDTL